MNLETILNTLASANVTMEEYPEPIPTIEDQIQAKRDAKTNYLKGVREKNKTDHLAKLKKFDDDITDLTAQNEQIIQDNRDARQAIKDKYASDIEAFKTLESTKWSALAIIADKALKESEWMLITDSTLTTEQKTVAKAYRKSLMDLKKNHETADEAITAFEALEKPDWKLW